METYQQQYIVTWSDLDANVHMRNTAYLDYAAQTRFAYFASQGFPPAEFARAAIGPAIFEDRVQYKKELRFLAPFTVDQTLGGLSEDASRMIFCNRILRGEDGVVCAVVETHAAWFSLTSRKIVAPPEPLAQALRNLVRNPEFRLL